MTSLRITRRHIIHVPNLPKVRTTIVFSNNSLKQNNKNTMICLRGGGRCSRNPPGGSRPITLINLRNEAKPLVNRITEGETPSLWNTKRFSRKTKKYLLRR
ncbi:hypothetical protein AVEN_257372-1 [Araneus ventricosus]|uniref:Uncharacterized protein n=1 Tax=Araneus ventricosus TaxID=182803 RepID=A0A4Y2C9Z5_ARAVE|nr:hypothetical protein AVEN_257372-1 [Araneus ventricosus]